MNNRLYHFTNYTSLIRILENNNLKLGNIVNTNDPKEYLEPNISYEHYTDAKNEISSLTDLFQKTAKELQKYKIICFCREGKAKGFMRPKMWSEYGQHHEGCCLIFDKSVFINELKNKYKENVILGNISYTAENGVKIAYKNTQNIEQFVNENISYFLFTKSYDWKMEDEFRCLIRSEKEVFVSIIQSIVGIVFGHKFSPILKEAVVSHFTKDLEYYDLNWNNGLCVSNKCEYSNYAEFYLRKCINRFQYGMNYLCNKLDVVFYSSFDLKLKTLEQMKFINNEQKDNIKTYYNILQNKEDFEINELRDLFKNIDSFFTNIEEKDN